MFTSVCVCVCVCIRVIVCFVSLQQFAKIWDTYWPQTGTQPIHIQPINTHVKVAMEYYFTVKIG